MRHYNKVIRMIRRMGAKRPPRPPLKLLLITEVNQHMLESMDSIELDLVHRINLPLIMCKRRGIWAIQGGHHHPKILGMMSPGPPKGYIRMWGLENNQMGHQWNRRTKITAMITDRPNSQLEDTTKMTSILDFDETGRK